MNGIIIFIFASVLFFLGAAAHESDMKRNCEETGNAKAWFVDISCTSNKQN